MHVVCWHRFSEELLSDWGTNFMYDLIHDIPEVLGVKNINTSGNHPYCYENDRLNTLRLN